MHDSIRETFEPLMNNGTDFFGTIDSAFLQNYGNIVDGTKKEITAFPPLWTYPDSVGKHALVVEDQLGERLAKLKEKCQKTAEDREEMDYIESFLRMIRPKTAERDVFYSLLHLVSQMKGILIHSFDPSQYLKVFRKRARVEQKSIKIQNRTGKPFRLTDLQNGVLKALNITVDIPQMVSEVLSNLNAITGTINDGTFKGQSIHEAINNVDRMSSNSKEQAKSKFKNGDTDYTRHQIEANVSHAIYSAETSFQGEMDFLVILPQYRTLINVEVKKQMTTGKATPNGQLKTASKQAMRNARYVGRVHGDALDKEWNFLKLAAILPGELDYEHICDHCRKFIITDVRDERKLSKWLRKNILPQEFQTRDWEEEKSYQQFANLAKRLISYSSVVTEVVDPSWQQIQGRDMGGQELVHRTGMSGGHTKARQPRGVNNDRFSEDFKNRPMDAEKCIFFNPDQARLLTAEIFRVIFCSDYSTGKKTVVLHTF